MEENQEQNQQVIGVNKNKMMKGLCGVGGIILLVSLVFILLKWNKKRKRTNFVKKMLLG